MPSFEHAITARDIVRKFGKVEALKGVSLDVREGEIYGFLGPNGAGKSTLVRIMTGLLLPTAGQISILGLDVVKQNTDVKIVIGVTLQELSIDIKQTGRELLRLQGQLYGLSRAAINQRIKDLEELIDIGDALDRLTETYSGGMKRRLDLAMAMVHQPKVLFLDEPTTGLDPLSRKNVWAQIRKINREQGVTVFLTTQYLEEVDVLADRVSIIDDGKIVVEGTPAELKRSVGSDIIVLKVRGDSSQAQKVIESVPGVDKVQVFSNEVAVSVSNGAAMISKVALAMEKAGLEIDEIALRTPTLDDVFLQVTGARIEERHQDQRETEGTPVG